MINILGFLFDVLIGQFIKRVLRWDELLTASTVLRGRYQIRKVHELGKENPVYLAHDKYLGRDVAIKENTYHDVPRLHQFQVETTILANLDHPNLPKGFDYFMEDGRQFFVMDYIEGKNLQQLMGQRKPGTEEILDWAGQLCDILIYLHSRIPAIIHRDIEPSNIILTGDGEIFLVDFGYAKIYEPPMENFVEASFSIPKSAGGEYREMTDPQKARLVTPLVTDQRSDEYSLAATLYALLTGKPPVDSRERMFKKTKLESIRAIRPDLPPYAENAIYRALSLDPNKRYCTVGDFKSALEL